MGGLFGCQLHLLISHLGETVALRITIGGEDESKPVLEMTDVIWGKL